MITRHALRTLASGEQKRHRWVAYGCFAAHKGRLRRKAGLPPGENECENFEIAQGKVLPLLLAYLRKLSRALSPADVSRMQRLSEEMQRQSEEKRREMLRPQGAKARTERAVQRANLKNSSRKSR